MTAHRITRGAAFATAICGLLAGCGITTTSVPVDAGAAPSRTSCQKAGSSATTAPPTDASGSPRPGHTAVFLVCGSSLVAVDRSGADLGGSGSGGRAQRVEALLAQLRQAPSPSEERAGFSTAVPETLSTRAAAPGDPATTLRLSVPPDDLPTYALAQIVCTFSASDVTGSQPAVLLGGPTGTGSTPPHRYRCTRDVLAHPDIAQNKGWGTATPRPEATG